MQRFLSQTPIMVIVTLFGELSSMLNYISEKYLIKVPDLNFNLIKYKLDYHTGSVELKFYKDS